MLTALLLGATVPFLLCLGLLGWFWMKHVVWPHDEAMREHREAMAATTESEDTRMQRHGWTKHEGMVDTTADTVLHIRYTRECQLEKETCVGCVKLGPLLPTDPRWGMCKLKSLIFGETVYTEVAYRCRNYEPGTHEWHAFR